MRVPRVRAICGRLGGIERFVKPGNDVIIKPNICVAYHTYEYAATTNPWVVGSTGQVVLDAGARRVRVMDSPFGGTRRAGLRHQRHSGAGHARRRRDGNHGRVKFVDADIPSWNRHQDWRIYDDILNADVVINVPIAKITAWRT